LFCLDFLHTWFTSHNYYVYFTLCSLHVCVGYCLLSRLSRFRLVCAGFCFVPVLCGSLYFVLGCCTLWCLTCSLGICFCDAVAFCSNYIASVKCFVHSSLLSCAWLPCTSYNHCFDS
jgi:hypothetical protein